MQVSRSIDKDDTADSWNGLQEVAQVGNQAVHQNSEEKTMAKAVLNALGNRKGAGEPKGASSPQQKRGSQEESGCITSGAEERQGSHLCVSIKHEEGGSNGGKGDERGGQAGRNSGYVEAESAVTKKKERKSTDAGNVGSVDAAAGASGKAGALKRRSTELSQLFEGGNLIEDAARKRRQVNHADGGMSSLAMPMQPTAPTTLFSTAKKSNPNAQKESRGSAGGKRDSTEEDRKKEKEKSGKKSKKKSEPEIFAIDRILDKRTEKGK